MLRAECPAPAQVDEDGENQGELLPSVLRELLQPVEPRHNDDAQHWQNHRRREETQHGADGAAARVLP